MKAQILHLLTQSLTSCAVLFIMTALALTAGCGRRQKEVRSETVTEITLFDSSDSSHPSSRDSRWVATNIVMIAQISSIAQDNTPLGECPAVGSMQTVDALNRTNSYSIVHIHSPKTIRLGDIGVVLNGDVVLQNFARIGVPTNKLFATSGEH